MNGTLETIIDSVGVDQVMEAIGRILRGEKSEWEICDGRPSEDAEWFEWRGVRYCRRRRPRESGGPPSRKKISCPWCGARAYPQSVCPRCSKGKAGIRKMWVCGEDADHVFYTER